jgi:archaemetzincin
MRRALVILLGLLAIVSCARESTPSNHATMPRAETLPEPFENLRPIAIPKRAPGVSDWLSMHREPGQSLAAFEAQPHPRPRDRESMIVLSRLGPTSPAQVVILARVARYLRAFYGLPVRFGADLDPATIPAHARRASHGFGEQLETRYVLDSLLVAHPPENAHVHVALSTMDLYPEQGWNFVFGQALPSKRVGVWSIARFGNPDQSKAQEEVVLARTLRTASHEIGHLLGLPHCIEYECLMNGSNHLDELDARPLELCPVCMAKICGSLGLDPVFRAQGLVEVMTGLGLASDAARERKLQRLLGVEEGVKPDAP